MNVKKLKKKMHGCRFVSLIWYCSILSYVLCIYVYIIWTAAMAQWVRALTPHTEGWVFESQPRQTLVVKTGIDSSTDKRSAVGVSVTGPCRWPLYTDVLCHSRCSTLKNPHCSMAIIAEHKSKFAALLW